MTEKVKMLKGEIYNPNYDKELIEERTRMQDLCYEYNNLRPSEIQEKRTFSSLFL